MGAHMATYSPQEFFQKYQSEIVVEPYTLDGLIKPGNGPNTIQFGFVPCETWIDVPVTLIDTISYITEVPCKDHKHPYVALAFAKSHSPEITALIALMEALETARRPKTPRITTQPPDGGAGDGGVTYADCVKNCNNSFGPGKDRIACVYKCGH